MADISANQRAAITRMAASKEDEEDGFAILAKRPDAHLYFELLNENGFFRPSKIPPMVPGDKDGSFRVPYWPALDYLEAVAKYAASESNDSLISAIYRIVISISQAALKGTAPKENFYTWWKFAEIICVLPISRVTQELIAVMPIWFSGPFDSGLVAQAVGMKLLPRLLDSGDQGAQKAALSILRYFTELRWVENPSRNNSFEIKPVVDDYWLSETLSKVVQPLAIQLPHETADLFRLMLQTAFSRSPAATSSWLVRPAVENHTQNHDWDIAENAAVEGLRDALDIWVSKDDPAAKAYLRDLVTNGTQIERRIAVYVLSKRFDILQSLFEELFSAEILDHNLLHETYGLLRSHFEKLQPEWQRRVIDQIYGLNYGDTEEQIRTTKRIKRTWLSALLGMGHPDVERCYQALVNEMGSDITHPDFLSYTETLSGPGPSPYTTAELYSFLLDGSLVEKLNGFAPSDSWRGPTKRALVDVLEDVISTRPIEFADVADKFLQADRTYQYGFIAAYKRSWETRAGATEALDWTKLWSVLLHWITTLISDEAFWEEEVVEEPTLTPNRDWIPGLVASLIRSAMGTGTILPREMFPAAKNVVVLLLEHLRPESMAHASDPVTAVINSHRGQTLEALIDYSLCQCRFADAEKHGHEAIWKAEIAPLFDRELALMDDDNSEFVVLFGYYLVHFQYFSPDWAERTFPAVFKISDSVRLKLALAGLVFAPASSGVYRLLKDHHVFNAALELGDLPDLSRERLIERIGLALLWNDEVLDGPIFEGMFVRGREGDVETIAALLGRTDPKQLSAEQVEMARRFWRKATHWARKQESVPTALCASLTKLLSYFEVLTDIDGAFVIWLAPFANSNFKGGFFVDELARLAERNMPTVAAALREYVTVNRPGYDLHGRLLGVTEKIAGAGYKEDAVCIANVMVALPEFRDLYKRIK